MRENPLRRGGSEVPQHLDVCHDHRPEGKKEVNLLMCATTEVDWHVSVWSEQSMNLSDIKTGSDVFVSKGLTICPHRLGHDV